MDFNFQTYSNLLNALLSQGYLFKAITDWEWEHDSKKTILLRHDAESRYHHSLHFAKMQDELGIKGTYYFRLFPNSKDGEIIRKIAELGHEIGYHYDDLSVCRGDYNQAIRRFEKNLSYLRSIAPVKTICMEGAPVSKYNNLDLWKKYNYRDFGIEIEPYLDLDFSKIFYLTDTGRRWDGKYAVRDKPMKKGSAKLRKDERYKEQENENKQHDKNQHINTSPHQQFLSEEKSRERSDSGNQLTNQPINQSTNQPNYRTTHDIIRAIEAGTFPHPDNYRGAMLNFHPQRWHDKPLPWLKEFIWQNIKNQGKWLLIEARKKR